MLGPFVGEKGLVEFADTYDLSADGDGAIHQLAVGVIEIVFELNAIGVLKFQCLIVGFVVVGVDGEDENPRLHLGFVEHPLVEKEVVITGGRGHEGDVAALWT